IRPRFLASFFDGVEHVETFVLRAAFARGDAADNVRAVLDCLKCVERTFTPGKTLHNQPRIFIDKYTHIFLMAARLRACIRSAHLVAATTFSAASFIPSATMKLRPECRRIS